MKVAIIHYWFIHRRGGEKVVESILKLYPKADIYTLFYDPKTYGNYLSKNTIYTSALNIPILRRYYKLLFPLYPFGIRSLKLKAKYDLIISSESGPAKGLSKPTDTPHLSYVHTPMRYCWVDRKSYLQSINGILRPVVNFLLNRLQQWDISTIDNVNLYIANSENVKQRILKYYNKSSIVIYPPISPKLFSNPLIDTKKEIYISMGAIVPYKKIELLVDTFNENGKSLVIIGDGSEKQSLISKAKPNISFEPYLPWEKIEDYFSKSKALIFPGEEDLGMIPLEVMAYGIPVIAFAKGGALETVLYEDSDFSVSTGVFFDEQTPQSLQQAIDIFEDNEAKFNKHFIRDHAQKFKEDVFLQKMKSNIETFLSSQ